MSEQQVSTPNRFRQDDRVPVLDLSPRIRYRRPPSGAAPQPVGPGSRVQQAVTAAGWPGVALPAADILGSVVVPVVSFTGARQRVTADQEPMLDLEILDTWEVMPTEETPAAPLQIVGFVATARRWRTAVEQVRSLAGLGAGLVVTTRRPSTLSMLDADASGIWVVGAPPAEPLPRLWVTGRTGPAATARRVTATRMMEEALFAHSLDNGLDYDLVR